MLTRFLSLLILLATCLADLYPLHEVAVRDPKSFDLLYSSTSGTHNETWHFAKPTNLSALIIASQAFNFNSGGLWPGGTYGEELQIEVYETVLARDAADEVTTLVGSGSISGPTYFGWELRVPVRSPNGTAVPLGQYYSTVNGYSYTFSVSFGSVGFYPWYSSMTRSAYSPVHQDTDGAGLIMGIAFSDG